MCKNKREGSERQTKKLTPLTEQWTLAARRQRKFTFAMLPTKVPYTLSVNQLVFFVAVSALLAVSVDFLSHTTPKNVYTFCFSNMFVVPCYQMCMLLLLLHTTGIRWSHFQNGNKLWMQKKSARNNRLNASKVAFETEKLTSNIMWQMIRQKTWIQTATRFVDNQIMDRVSLSFPWISYRDRHRERESKWEIGWWKTNEEANNQWTWMIGKSQPDLVKGERINIISFDFIVSQCIKVPNAIQNMRPLRWFKCESNRIFQYLIVHVTLPNHSTW